METIIIRPFNTSKNSKPCRYFFGIVNAPCPTSLFHHPIYNRAHGKASVSLTIFSQKFLSTTNLMTFYRYGLLVSTPHGIFSVLIWNKVVWKSSFLRRQRKKHTALFPDLPKGKRGSQVNNSCYKSNVGRILERSGWH